MEIPRHTIDDALLAKYLDGSCSGQERAAVESWIAQSPENEKVVADFESVWRKSEGVGFDEQLQFDRKAGFLNVLERIKQAEEKHPANKQSGKSFHLTVFFSRVAAILILGVLAYLMYRGFQSDASELTITAYKENLEFSLPDRTVVNLAGGGEIHYATDFSSDRRLSLSGKAFFEVEKQEDNPFTAEVRDLEVRVLGTSFYISALETDTLIEVGVKTGIVEVVQIKSGQTIRLTANEMTRYNTVSRSFSDKKELNTNQLFWKSSVLEFTEQSLDEVLSTLSQAYQTDIIFEKEDLENCRFTGRFENATLDEILLQLQLSFEIEVTQNEEIRVTGKSCDP